MSTVFDKSFQGETEAVLLEVLNHIQRNYVTKTIIKHPDHAESTQFWNFSITDVEAALRKAATADPSEGNSAIGVQIGYHALTVQAASRTDSPGHPQRYPVDTLIRVHAHPLARSPVHPASASDTQ